MNDSMSDDLIDHLYSLLAKSSKQDFLAFRSNEVTIEEGRLCFTLNGLHQLVQTVYPVDYNDFQQRLYASNLNERLAEVGLTIVVHQSTGKVASNWYVLAAKH